MKTTGKISDSDLAYNRIKEMIIRGQIEQGQVLSVLYFSELLNLGRMPVTIACQKLEVNGFLRIIPKQGVLISPITINDARDLYEAREAIEMYLAERAFANITAEDIVELEKSIARQEEFGAAGDAYGFMEEDTYFHRYILQRYPNRILIGMHHTMTDRIFLIGVHNSSNPARLQESIDNHKRQIACIKAGDKQGFLREVSANQVCGYLSITAMHPRL